MNFTITLHKFPTHVAKTDNKVAPNKMLKINNQAIYNGFIGRFTRNIVIKNLQVYLINNFIKVRAAFRKQVFSYPLKVRIDIHTVRNHGSISLRKGKLCWKPVEDGYSPNWDIENLASAWTKVINDALTKARLIPDDNIQYITSVEYNYVEVEELDDRKIVITITEHEGRKCKKCKD